MGNFLLGIDMTHLGPPRYKNGNENENCNLQLVDYCHPRTRLKLKSPK
uniref:Uncharacterized protein n=1 Tax=Nelumbo nucifera TaxID=4432 RepID=A0A822Y3J7_NELNU|nr:TPA_asm: hypothetical protein HUJ06_025661 [Nelumbo nucifera]